MLSLWGRRKHGYFNFFDLNVYEKNCTERDEIGKTMDLCWLAESSGEEKILQNIDLIGCVAAAFRKNANYFDIMTKN